MMRMHCWLAPAENIWPGMICNLFEPFSSNERHNLLCLPVSAGTRWPIHRAWPSDDERRHECHAFHSSSRMLGGSFSGGVTPCEQRHKWGRLENWYLNPCEDTWCPYQKGINVPKLPTSGIRCNFHQFWTLFVHVFPISRHHLMSSRSTIALV